MKEHKPEWVDLMKDDPFVRRTFTQENMKRIEDRAMNLSKHHSSLRRFTMRRAISISIVSIALIVAIGLYIGESPVGKEEPIASFPAKPVPNTPTDQLNSSETQVEDVVSVKKIDRYENIAISDWLDEDTVVVSKENEDLSKMSLEELSDSYPKSLYLYDLNTKQYKLIKEQKNVFLGDAVLSSDKKHLLYSEFSLGDPVFHVMDMDTLDSFGIMGDPIGGALSAGWGDVGTVIGPAYSGGAFTASTSGEIAAVPGLQGEALVVVQKMKDKIYYNTNSNESLQALDLNTKEKASLNLDHVYGVFPSSDGNQMLVSQYNDPKQTLILCDEDGGNRKVIAEGTELGGVSWSPDMRMIAYTLKDNVNGTPNNGLYIYDMLTDKSTQIAVDIENLTTTWSPSGRELAYTEWSGNQQSSSIVHLN